jgi:hypothetical protein
VWRDRANAVQQETVTSELVQGLVAYASKQAAMYTALAARARRIELAPKLGRGKSRRRVVAEYDLLVAQPDEDEEDDDADDENKRVEDQGEIDSDEELIMGGEVDDDVVSNKC